MFQSLQLEKVLTRLDGIPLPDGNTELRATRKGIIKEVQVELERTDAIQVAVEAAESPDDIGGGDATAVAGPP